MLFTGVSLLSRVVCPLVSSGRPEASVLHASGNGMAEAPVVRRKATGGARHGRVGKPGTEVTVAGGTGVKRQFQSSAGNDRLR